MILSEFVLRLGIATIAGFLIGIERQWRHKSAGLRTNTLVSTGAAIYVIISFQMTEHGNGDVTRIVGQVVTGVGFLGAGIIFKEGFSIHGLTTAATVWCSSAVGCMAATGHYVETLLATAFIVGINLVFLPIDNWISKRNPKKDGEDE